MITNRGTNQNNNNLYQKYNTNIPQIFDIKKSGLKFFQLLFLNWFKTGIDPILTILIRMCKGQ